MRNSAERIWAATGLTDESAVVVLRLRGVMSNPRVADIPRRQAVARRVARFLRFMRGRVVSADMLIEYVYGDRPSGPPNHAIESLCSIVWRLNRLGFPIGSVRGRRAFVWDADRVFVRRRNRAKASDTLPSSPGPTEHAA